MLTTQQIRDAITILSALWILLGSLCVVVGVFAFWLAVIDWTLVNREPSSSQPVIVARRAVRWAGTHLLFALGWLAIGLMRLLSPMQEPIALALAVRVTVLLCLTSWLLGLSLDLYDRHRLLTERRED